MQECQNATTSTEFIEWMVMLHDLEWQQTHRQDYYLAQITAEIRRFREAFAKDPKPVSVEDCLIPFKQEGEPTPPVKTEKKTQPREPLEAGLEAIKDPKWAQVNTAAKSKWGAFLGVEIPSEVSDGNSGAT